MKVKKLKIFLHNLWKTLKNPILKAQGTHLSLTVETVSDFIFLGSKITTDGDCSHEIKRRLLLGRKL